MICSTWFFGNSINPWLTYGIAHKRTRGILARASLDDFAPRKPIQRDPLALIQWGWGLEEEGGQFDWVAIGATSVTLG